MTGAPSKLTPLIFLVIFFASFKRGVGESTAVFEALGAETSSRIFADLTSEDLTNIRTVLRCAANKNIIPDSMVPKIHFYKTARKILPLYLNDDEIFAIANQLDGDALLAF